MVKNCVIVHGSNSTEEGSREGKPENLRHWKPWLKRSLEKEGFEVSNDLYPKDWLPDYEKWKKVFEKNDINEKTVLVGHSAGTAFIIRWLAENKRKVDKVILVAPSVIKTEKYITGLKRLSNLKDFTFDSSLKGCFNKLVVFYSEDDEDNIVESAKKVHEVLGGKLIHLEGHGHFCFDDMGTEEFPELLEVILN